MLNFVRLAIYKINSGERRLRGVVLTAYIRVMGGSCGSGLRVGRRVWFRHPPHKGIVFGSGVFLGSDLTIDVEPEARLTIGNRVKLTGYCIIGASGIIEIGDDSLIAEFTSIRDSNHGISRDQTISSQPIDPGAVCLGSDVWVGRGVAIIKGACVGNGAVIGANSVVAGEIPSMAIAVGAPAKVAKYRTIA